VHYFVLKLVFRYLFSAFDHRVHTEWQLPLSDVHSITSDKLAQFGEGGGARPPHSKLCTLQVRRQIHSPYFYSTPIGILWFRHSLLTTYLPAYILPGKKSARTELNAGIDTRLNRTVTALYRRAFPHFLSLW
jgi:hypothetical protein